MFFLVDRRVGESFEAFSRPQRRFSEREGSNRDGFNDLEMMLKIFPQSS